MMSTVVVFLLLVVDSAITLKREIVSTKIRCQPVIINWAEFTQPSATMCGSTCNGTDKFCVQTSSQHEHSNISAVCRAKQLTPQEVFLVYQHCQRPACRLEAVPGLMGPAKARFTCLEDDTHIVDPCEEGDYTLKSINFLYGYRRVVNSTSHVTCSCSLTKLSDSSHFNIRAVNAYSPEHVNNTFPELSVKYDNKKERVISSFPQDFIITTTTTNVSLTLTVSTDHRIGRMWVSISQKGQGFFSVQCVAVSGFIPVGTQETVPWILSALVGIDAFVVICLVILSIFCWGRKLQRKKSLDGAGRSKSQAEQPAAGDMVDERGHMTLRDVDASRDSHVRNASSLCLRPFERIVQLAQRYRTTRVLAITECAPIV